MGSLTSDRPKCLLEVEGRTLLDRQLAALRAGGIAEVAVVTGWHAERFAAAALPRFHNADWARSSMVDSLACAWPWLVEGPVLACYGDIVFSRADVAAMTHGGRAHHRGLRPRLARAVGRPVRRPACRRGDLPHRRRRAHHRDRGTTGFGIRGTGPVPRHGPLRA
ncbi:NTP transferase domain-containing protein [Saccharomonospora sp. NPDC006951]